MCIPYVQRVFLKRALIMERSLAGGMDQFFYYTIYGPNSVEEVVGDLCEIVCYIIFSS